MNFGAWKVNPVVGAMPQKVASAVGALGETLLGATYEPIAYLASQQANGINHAVLAKQTVISGVDSVNIVILKFNEKDMECSLYAIEEVLKAGQEFGGYAIDVKVGNDIPESASETFTDVTKNWVGTDVKPIALLASKVVKGVNFTFAAKVTPVVRNPVPSIKLVTVNSLMHTIDFVDVL